MITTYENGKMVVRHPSGIVERLTVADLEVIKARFQTKLQRQTEVINDEIQRLDTMIAATQASAAVGP